MRDIGGDLAVLESWLGGSVTEPTAIPYRATFTGSGRLLGANGEWLEITQRPSSRFDRSDEGTHRIGSATARLRSGWGSRSTLSVYASDSWTVDFDSYRYPAETVVAVAESVPVFGSAAELSPSEEPPLASQISTEMISDSFSVGGSEVELEGALGPPGGGVATIGEGVQNGFVLAVASAEDNPLNEIAFWMSSPRIGSVAQHPSLEGVFDDGRRQVAWIQRGWFWHLLSARSIDLLRGAAEGLASRVGGVA